MSSLYRKRSRGPSAACAKLRHSVAPRVIVFVPTYNRAGLLRPSLDSILAQTYGDFRLEISDNASTDDTPAIVESYDDPRIDYTRQPENLGMLGNHNWFLNGWRPTTR